MPFNVGPLELVIVLVIALLILGPKRLPEVGKSIGNGMREFKDAISGSGKTTTTTRTRSGRSRRPSARSARALTPRRRPLLASARPCGSPAPCSTGSSPRPVTRRPTSAAA